LTATASLISRLARHFTQ